MRYWILAMISAVAMIGTGAQAVSVWTGSRHIVYIFPQDTGLVVNLDGANINPTPGCPPNWMFLPTTAGNYEAIVSSILLSYSQGKAVDVRYDDTTLSSCAPVMNALVAYS